MTLKEEISKVVEDYPTRYKEGFMPDELQILIDLYPNLNMKYYDDAMMGNTCTMHDDKFCIYHIDVYHALLAGLEERNLKIDEWD